MPSTRKLSLEYEWRQEGHHNVLHFGEHALLQIDPDRDVWVLRSLLKAPGLTPLRFAVRTVEIGKSKAESWTMERQHIIAHACGGTTSANTLNGIGSYELITCCSIPSSPSVSRVRE